MKVNARNTISGRELSGKLKVRCGLDGHRQAVLWDAWWMCGWTGYSVEIDVYFCRVDAVQS